MRQLVKGSSILTAVSIGEMLMRFVRTKFIAILLGPAGTGFVGQLTILFEALRVWGDLGSRRGVIKQVAERRREGKESPHYRQVISTSYVLAISASVIVGAGVALLSHRISHTLLGNYSAVPYIIFLGVLLPFASVTTITASIVKGNLDFRPFAIYTLVSYLLVMLLTPFLIYRYMIWGALIVQALFFIFPLIGYLLYNRKSRFLNFAPKINKSALGEQFSYGSLHIYQDSLTHLTRIIVAAWIVKRLGLDVMGLYQVVITFSSVYLTIPMQAISGYTFPLIAAAQSKEEVNKAVNDSMRFLLFILVPIIASLMIWPEILISLFFSADFVSAAPVLRIQLFGTVFTLIMQSYGAGLGAKGNLKAIFAGATIHSLVFISLAGIFFGSYGLSGVAAASSTAYFVLLIVFLICMKHYYGTSINPKNQRLLAASFLWLAAAYAGSFFYDSIGYRCGMLSVGILWFFYSSKNHEREYLFTKACALLRIKKGAARAPVKPK